MKFKQFFRENFDTTLERLANLIRVFGREGFQKDHENGLFDFEWKFSKRLQELPESAQRNELQFLSQTQKALQQALANPEMKDRVENLFIVPSDNSILSLSEVQRSIQSLLRHFQQPSQTNFRPQNRRPAKEDWWKSGGDPPEFQR